MDDAIEPNDLLLFARVVDSGSFSRAAEKAQLPKSTVSRRISELERRLGERLLQRTTRKLSVTDFGTQVLEHARQVALEVDGTVELAAHRQARPSGRLRVSMPGDFASAALADVMARFVCEHPAVELEVDLSPRRVDLVGENYDLAIRIGELPADSQLAARRLAVFGAGLYAAPSYLARQREPQHPDDLVDLHGLVVLARGGEPWTWDLLCESDRLRWRGLPAKRTLANSPELLIRMARAGAGVAAVPHYFAEPYARSGELRPVLPGWVAEPSVVWAVFPERRLMAAKTRAFLDALSSELKVPAEVEARCVEAERERRAAKAVAAAATATASSSLSAPAAAMAEGDAPA